MENDNQQSPRVLVIVMLTSFIIKKEKEDRFQKLHAFSLCCDNLFPTKNKKMPIWMMKLMISQEILKCEATVATSF